MFQLICIHKLKDSSCYGSPTKRGERGGSKMRKKTQKLPCPPSDFSVKFGLLNVCSIVNSTDLFVDIILFVDLFIITNLI